MLKTRDFRYEFLRLYFNTRLRAANNFPAGAGQIVRWNQFLLGHIPFLAGQTSIIIIILNSKFFPYQRKRPDKLSGHLRIWPDKTYFWPDIVRWPAVICSPATGFLNYQKTFNGVWTRDLAIPVQRSNQQSYEATNVGSWSFMTSNQPVKNGCEVIYEMKCNGIAGSQVQTPLKSWLFQASIRNCVHNCEDHSLLKNHFLSQPYNGFDLDFFF